MALHGRKQLLHCPLQPTGRKLPALQVVDGKREQQATKEGLKAPADKWHKLSITMKGNAVECSLNGTKQIAAKDDTFAKAGQIGLWTKADAETYFDELQAKSLK